MIRLSLFTCVFLIGLSMATAKNELKFRNIHQKRFSRHDEQIRLLRNLMGKLIDTETKTIYTVDGEKQPEIPWDTDATTTMVVPAPLAINAPPNHEEIACLAACHSCVEDYPMVSIILLSAIFTIFFFKRKKKAADNCGPMCDCADSCFLMSIEQVKRRKTNIFVFNN
jgi:hypothetical protein